MLRNFITVLYFAIVAIFCVFIFISVNFIIASSETIANNFNKIIVSKILYTIVLDFISIGILYLVYLALRKLMNLKTENKNILKLLTIIFTTVSIIALITFLINK